MFDAIELFNSFSCYSSLDEDIVIRYTDYRIHIFTKKYDSCSVCTISTTLNGGVETSKSYPILYLTDDGFRTVYSSQPLFEHDDSYDEISIHNIMPTNSSIRINNNLELDVVFMGLIKKNKLRYSMIFRPVYHGDTYNYTILLLNDLGINEVLAINNQLEHSKEFDEKITFDMGDSNGYEIYMTSYNDKAFSYTVNKFKLSYDEKNIKIIKAFKHDDIFLFKDEKSSEYCDEQYPLKVVHTSRNTLPAECIVWDNTINKRKSFKLV